MASFYGGINGQSFEIKKVFTSYKKLIEDLIQGWNSSIQIGEYVFVSYGIPNEPPYFYYIKDNKKVILKEKPDGDTYLEDGILYQVYPAVRFLENEDEDFSTYGKTYNATFWQKICVDKEEDLDKNDAFEPSTPGLAYKLISSFGGKAPKIDSTYEVLNANESPFVTTNNDKLDSFILTFHIPLSERAIMQVGTPVNAGVDPWIEYDNGVNYWGQNGVAEPTKVSDAEKEDYINHPRLTFHIPLSEKMQNAVYDVVGPAKNPKVELVQPEISNRPQLKFELPRAVKFFYGEAVSSSNQSVNLSDCLVGDYYININTGYIYEAINKSGDNIIFQERACLRAPAPETSTHGISPYKEQNGNWISAEPTVSENVTDTGWSLDLGIPKAPRPQILVNEYPSDGTASGSVSIKDEDTIKFELNIPRGSRLYTGSEIPSSIADSKTGDYYLRVTSSDDADNGTLYKLGSSGWILQPGSLKGPTGKWGITNSYEIHSSDILITNTNGIGAYIETQLGRIPSNSELFGIRYIEGNNAVSSYWAFKATTGWQVLLASGSSALSFVSNKIDDSSIMGYSVEYINNLEKDLQSWGKFSELIG